MRWAEEQRIEWLGNRREPFRRKDLMETFKISLPQASHDIQKFIKLFPDIWEYNLSKKQYQRYSEMIDKKLNDALENPDWGQLIANGGPPCFHLDDDKLCFRAKRWPGHDGGSMHQYVSLHEFLAVLSNSVAAAKLSQGD